MSEFSLDTPRHISKSDITHTKNTLNIPVSVNLDSIGKPLEVKVSDNIITFISISINGKQVNFLDLIKEKAKILPNTHKDNIISFDKAFNFYLLRDKYKYVLAVK